MSGSFGKGLGCTGRMESASGRISIVLIQVQQIHNYIPGSPLYSKPNNNNW